MFNKEKGGRTNRNEFDQMDNAIEELQANRGIELTDQNKFQSREQKYLQRR